MIGEWNRNMAAHFYAGWVVCLDELIWHNRWTCPGWVFCPRKPHPFGNEYHSACCGLSGIIVSIEMVEGKEKKPAERGGLEFEGQFGKTGGLLLCMMKDYFNTGRYVVLDSDFCVLQAIVGLYAKGLFAGALIKKSKYWPNYIPGDAIDARFVTLATGEVGALTGMLQNTRYYVWGMKEPDYVMKIMATGGTLESDDSCKVAYRGNGPDQCSFRYTPPCCQRPQQPATHPPQVRRYLEHSEVGHESLHFYLSALRDQHVPGFEVLPVDCTTGS